VWAAGDKEDHRLRDFVSTAVAGSPAMMRQQWGVRRCDRGARIRGVRPSDGDPRRAYLLKPHGRGEVLGVHPSAVQRMPLPSDLIWSPAT
jgi:hypothetical protein